MNIEKQQNRQRNGSDSNGQKLLETDESDSGNSGCGGIALICREVLMILSCCYCCFCCGGNRLYSFCVCVCVCGRLVVLKNQYEGELNC